MADNRPTLIIGSEGSMGKRYQAILSSLKKPFVCVDMNHSPEYITDQSYAAGEIILCTPTDEHFSYLKRLIPLAKPILCEKPITKSLKELEKIFSAVESYNSPFTMTFQYTELVPENQAPGDSHYDYFRSGKDGLFWDCLQIIALSKGALFLGNQSPTWSCQINDLTLNLSDMDGAYLSFIQKWLSGEIKQDPNSLFKIHERVERFAKDGNY